MWQVLTSQVLRFGRGFETLLATAQATAVQPGVVALRHFLSRPLESRERVQGLGV
jgi:hypothetical protein